VFLKFLMAVVKYFILHKYRSQPVVIVYSSWKVGRLIRDSYNIIDSGRWQDFFVMFLTAFVNATFTSQRVWNQILLKIKSEITFNHIFYDNHILSEIIFLTQIKKWSKTSRYTARLSQKTKHFRWRNVFDDICRVSWSWFDVNRSTILMKLCVKTIVTFSFQWPWSLTSNLFP